MRKETRAKLEWQERRDRWLVPGAVLLAVLAGFSAFAVWMAPYLSRRPVEAIVTFSAVQNSPSTGRMILTLQARLPTGELIHGTGVPQPPPAAGTAVILVERVNIIGYRSYWWTGEKSAGPEAQPDVKLQTQ